MALPHSTWVDTSDGDGDDDDDDDGKCGATSGLDGTCLTTIFHGEITFHQKTFTFPLRLCW